MLIGLCCRSVRHGSSAGLEHPAEPALCTQEASPFRAPTPETIPSYLPPGLKASSSHDLELQLAVRLVIHLPQAATVATVNTVNRNYHYTCVQSHPGIQNRESIVTYRSKPGRESDVVSAVKTMKGPQGEV